MNAPQRSAHRAALEKQQQETRRAGPARIEPNRSDATSVGVADEDAQALSEMLQTLSSTRNKQQSELLVLIARALRKIDDAPDEYGICEDCEEDISSARLALLPYAMLCADCQAARDPKRGVARKSITDYK